MYIVNSDCTHEGHTWGPLFPCGLKNREGYNYYIGVVILNIAICHEAYFMVELFRQLWYVYYVHTYINLPLKQSR